MARLGYRFKSDAAGTYCSRVYPPERGIRPRGRASLGRVCFRESAPKSAQWLAVVQAVPGAEPSRGEGRTRGRAVQAALNAARRVADPKLRTLAEVADLTGIAKTTLCYWINAGALPSYGGRQRVHLVRCQDVRAAANTMHTDANRERARRCL